MQLQATSEVNVRSGPGVSYDILDTLEQGDVIEPIDLTGWSPIPMEDDTIGWVSSKYLSGVVIPTVPTVVKPVLPSGDPIWIGWARSKLGEKEGVNDPEIDSWFRLTTLPQEYWDCETTAWCAVFVNAAFCLNGIKGIRSARALDWLGFGTLTNSPQDGDVTVFQWSDGSHHVAFYLKDLGNGRIQCLGGNQGSAVTITSFPTGSVIGYRRPPS